MKRILAFLLLTVAAYAADATPVVSTATEKITAVYIAGAGKSDATGVLIYGGLGTTVDSNWSGKIVLLDRGTITFTQKLANVKNAGGLAVIVANNLAGIFTATLGTDTSTLTGLTVSQEDGLLLRQRVGQRVAVGSPVTITATITSGTIAPVIITSTRVVLGVLANATVTFLATADGTQPITFQWKREGVIIPGATAATYTIYGSTLITGNYTATATNVAGSAESSPYYLQVAQP